MEYSYCKKWREGWMFLHVSSWSRNHKAQHRNYRVNVYVLCYAGGQARWWWQHFLLAWKKRHLWKYNQSLWAIECMCSGIMVFSSRNDIICKNKYAASPRASNGAWKSEKYKETIPTCLIASQIKCMGNNSCLGEIQMRNMITVLCRGKTALWQREGWFFPSDPSAGPALPECLGKVKVFPCFSSFVQLREDSSWWSFAHELSSVLCVLAQTQGSLWAVFWNSNVCNKAILYVCKTCISLYESSLRFS